MSDLYQLAKEIYTRERRPDITGFVEWERARKKVKNHYIARAEMRAPTVEVSR